MTLGERERKGSIALPSRPEVTRASSRRRAPPRRLARTRIATHLLLQPAPRGSRLRARGQGSTNATVEEDRGSTPMTGTCPGTQERLIRRSRHCRRDVVVCARHAHRGVNSGRPAVGTELGAGRPGSRRGRRSPPAFSAPSPYRRARPAEGLGNPRDTFGAADFRGSRGGPGPSLSGSGRWVPGLGKFPQRAVGTATGRRHLGGGRGRAGLAQRPPPRVGNLEFQFVSFFWRRLLESYPPRIGSGVPCDLDE